MTFRHVRLLPEALFSVPVIGVSLLWGILVQVGEWAALGEDGRALVVRLITLCLVQGLMFAVPYLTWRVICPRVKSDSWNRLLLISVLVGAVVRGIALGLLLTLAGVSAQPDLTFRVVASLTHMAVIVLLLWFLVSEVRGLHARRRKLIRDRDQLLSLQQAAQRDLQQLNDRTILEIRSSILDSLGGLSARSSTELRERLRVTIDDVVRPLSHQLAAQPSPFVVHPSPSDVSSVDWSLAAREGLDPRRIHPVLIPVVLIWLGLPIHLFRFGPTLTAGLVATLVVAIPAFWLGRTVAIRATERRGSGARTAAFVLAVAFGGLALGLATLPYMNQSNEPFLFVAMGPVLALLISGPLAIAEAARDQDLELESDLMATTADLRWELARARERFRQQDRALAHALHGRLQAALTAAFLRLDRSSAHDEEDDQLVQELQGDVRDAIAGLEITGIDPNPIDLVVELTRSNWSGVAAVDFSLDAAARTALMGDPLCSRSINDLIPELVFNSVRHGGARAIDITIGLTDHRTVCLTVTDDGTGIVNGSHQGLGSALLDDSSISWSRTRTDGRTRTVCLLPIDALASEGSSP